MNKKILIVDDNFRTYKSLTLNFNDLGYTTAYASNGVEAIHALKHEEIDLVLLDLMLGDKDGRDVLDLIIGETDSPPVIMITGFGSIDSAVDSIKRGAYNYVQKPVDFDELLKLIENAFSISSDENSGIEKPLKKELYESLSAKMISVMEKARKLAATELPILILGENGTGKELMAEYIHRYSGRNSQKLHKINCAAFQESILDNELFGHNKGAYTGANEEFKGIFEQADGQTLFLDEIGDMSLSIQAKILRTLQNSEIRRIGGSKVINVDVRFIAATNKDIESMIESHDFRQDLFYRLNTAVIRIPALRERVVDIPFLVDGFLKNIVQDGDLSLNDDVLKLFLEYPWPGNIRELKNAIHYAAALSSGKYIQLEDLPGALRSFNKKTDFSDCNIREVAEKEIIVNTLEKHNFNKTRAALDLNMSRKTLYIKIEKYGIKAD